MSYHISYLIVLLLVVLSLLDELMGQSNNLSSLFCS